MPSPLQHVLCVDDEDDILEIVQLCLCDLKNIRVTCEAKVEVAIQSLSATAPDLILLDMMMPKINGMSAMGLFRKVNGYHKIPIVLMTARAQPHEIKQYLEGGATAVITKPFDPMTLGDKVIAIWNGHNVDK